jgi:hypothetical protein
MAALALIPLTSSNPAVIAAVIVTAGFQRVRRLVAVDLVDVTGAPCVGGPAAVPSTTG